MLWVGSPVGPWLLSRGVDLLLGCTFEEALGKMENVNTVFEPFYWGF